MWCWFWGFLTRCSLAQTGHPELAKFRRKWQFESSCRLGHLTPTLAAKQPYQIGEHGQVHQQQAEPRRREFLEELEALQGQRKRSERDCEVLRPAFLEHEAGALHQADDGIAEGDDAEAPEFSGADQVGLDDQDA